MWFAFNSKTLFFQLILPTAKLQQNLYAKELLFEFENKILYAGWNVRHFFFFLFFSQLWTIFQTFVVWFCTLSKSQHSRLHQAQHHISILLGLVCSGTLLYRSAQMSQVFNNSFICMQLYFDHHVLHWLGNPITHLRTLSLGNDF